MPNGYDQLNSGIKGIFSALAQAPLLEQQAQMDAGMKTAQANAYQQHGRLYGAQADQKQFVLDNSRHFASGGAPAIDLPPMVRNALYVSALNGEFDPEAVTKASGNLQKQGAISDAIGGQVKPEAVGRAFAAVEGKPLFDAVGTTGYSMDNFSGAIDPGLKTLYGNKTNSEIYENRASAAKSYSGINVDNANINKINAQTGKLNAASAPAQIGTDANGEPVYGIAPTGKPLPSAALKLQQEELERIGTASATQADLSAVEQQIADGKINFGLVSNLVNRGKNMAGLSDEQSRNFSSFRATMEKLRNDSLQLNKGVQTDGDAQRAWNELFDNINDKNVVAQRLAEIKRINARAVNLRRMNIDVIRANYGNGPLDVSGYTNMPAALNGGQNGGAPARPAPSGKTIVRTGRTPDGRRAVQYSDGTIDIQ